MLIKRAILKYGADSFKKDILGIYKTKREMDLAERIYVVVDKEISYNLKQGGEGGFDYINTHRPNEETRRRKLSVHHTGLMKNWQPGQIAGANKIRGKTYDQIFQSLDVSQTRKELNSVWMKHNNPNRIQVVCPYCGAKGSKPPMKRFHFDNCKKAKESE